MTPKNSVPPSTISTKRLLKFAQSTVLIAIASRISAPPIVGVPAFGKWLSGPTWRICWPMRCICSRWIRYGPNANDSTSAVSALKIARVVR